MTVLQRYGGWLLLLFGAGLALYGLVDQRDVVVVVGALLAAFAIALDRIGGVPRREASRSPVSAQLRRDIQAHITERLRQARNN